VRAASEKAILLSAVLAVSAGIAGAGVAAAGPPQLPAHFTGLINDYTPASVNGVPVKGAPYEIHGKWRLDLSWGGQAVFSAELTMETADFVNADPNLDPGKLGSHTHHIKVTDGMMNTSPTAWKTLCPPYSSPVEGFVVTGHAYVTGNGTNAPFGNPSPITICILGGMPSGTPGAAYVEYSNFEMMFGPKASGHFGTQAIHGVIVRCDAPWELQSHDCEVTVEK